MIDNAFDLVLHTMAEQYPQNVAFRYVAADGETVVEKTYAQYVEDIRRTVTYLRENVPDLQGRHIAILSKNCYEYGVIAFGAILAGGVVVTVNQKKTWPDTSWGWWSRPLSSTTASTTAAGSSWRPLTATVCAPWTPSGTALRPRD